MRRLALGILGTGNIARQFADAAAESRRCRVVAVGSRSEGAAEGFAEEFSLPRAHSSYEALLADDGVEAVYVSLPNSLHHAWTLRALEAGKHVLCEKPLATSTAEAEEMFDVAERCGRVLVEAFLYRSHPLTHAVVEQVRRGAIGELKLIRTSFCFRTRQIASNIRFDPGLAGGSLMDVGCYCISFARLLACCEPDVVQVAAHQHESGVDERAAGTLHFPGGVLSSFVCGMTVQADNTAYICGDEGYIEVPVPWKPPMHKARYVVAGMTPPRQDGGGTAPPRQVFEVDAARPVFALEADDFAAAVLDGAEPTVGREDSLGNMRVLEAMRQQMVTV
ncbi:MAG: Gfo/Idh/MocA family oxidoreductase [Phycisphaeraceae bacterium]